MIDIKGTGSALLDALQMKAAESSVLYNTSTRVSWSDSQSPSPPVILAEAAFGHGLCLSSTFLTVPSSLGAGSSQQVRSAAWDGRGAQGQPGTAGQQSRGFHPCGHRPPCLFHAWLVGTGHPETAGNLLCLWLLSPVFISQDSVAEKEGNLLSLSWLRHSKKAKINAIETEAIGT